MFEDNSKLTLSNNTTISMAEIWDRGAWSSPDSPGAKCPTGVMGSTIMQFRKEPSQGCVTLTTSSGRRITCGAGSKLMLEGGGYAVVGGMGLAESMRKSVLTESGPEIVVGVLPADPRDLWHLSTDVPHCVRVDGFWFLVE